MTVIDVSHLRKSYGDRRVLDDVTFSVGAGEIFGIVGPNGAGKTTTVESIAGIRSPDGGTIRVLGLDPRRDRDALRLRLGVQLQSGDLPDKMRVGEALSLYASFYPDPADPAALLADFGLDGHRTTAYNKLSGGLKQRVSIALALIGNPEVAILDELTTGLDPHARRETWRMVTRIRERGVTVLLVTHYMDEAERLCDRIAVIDDGRVAALDTPAGLRALGGPDASLEDAYVTLTTAEKTSGSNR
jgi:ABC-2 type transport system ATP-binding protein